MKARLFTLEQNSKLKSRNSARKQNLFITGMGGMVGRHLAQYAIERGYLVAGTINKNFPSELKTYIDMGMLKVYKADLMIAQQIKQALFDYQPDIVIHLAGRVLARTDIKVSDLSIFTENIKILKNLLSAIKSLSNRPKLVLASGCLVYERLKLPETIEEILVSDLPQIDIKKEPYRASRIEQEKLLVSEEDNKYLIVRPTQLTGPGKIPGVVEYFIAREVLKALNDPSKKIINIGNKLAEVDLIDARDAAAGFLIAAEKGISGEIYHLSSGFPVTVEKLIKSFLEIAGLNPDEYAINSLSREQSIYFRFSPKKLENLGWERKFSLKEALTSYFEYFKNQNIK